MSHTSPLHHRRSIRLQGYDYSQAGLYFITICCQERACLFGNVVNGKMGLNDAGKMAMKCWNVGAKNISPLPSSAVRGFKIGVPNLKMSSYLANKLDKYSIFALKLKNENS